MTEDRGQRSEVRGLMTEVRGQRSEVRRQTTEKKVEGGFGNLEVGLVVVPNERDYAAARMWKWES
jgi:hypothetical protein